MALLPDHLLILRLVRGHPPSLAQGTFPVLHMLGER
jgi:hypothetical protein